MSHSTPLTPMIDLIQNRQSIPLLTTPIPTAAEWAHVLAAAATAPDHGRLKPWRFFLVEGEARNQLGSVFLEVAETNAASNTSLTDQQRERTRNLPLRAPCILTVATKILHNHKIPVTEQISATAAATQNIQLALASLGYGCMWRTGDFAYQPKVKQAFGLEDTDEIIGFLYVGTPEKMPPPRTPQDLTSCFSHWQGAAKGEVK